MDTINDQIEKLDMEASMTEIEYRVTESIIYHYTSPSGLQGIVNHQGKTKLWFTQYNCLNDISERKDLMDFVHGLCDFNVKEQKISPEFCSFVKDIKLDDEILVTEKGPLYNGLETSSLSYEDSDTYLCCFSKHDDLLAMWNYYSKSSHYEGYSIGFWRHKFPVDFDKGYRLYVCNVIYENNKKVGILNKYLLPLSQLFDKADLEQRARIASIIKQLFDQLQFLFKNNHFYHEQEIRAILRIPRKYRQTGIMVDKDQGQEISQRLYRICNGIFVPYVEFYLPKQCVSSIKIAPLLERDLATENLKDMLKFLDHPGVIIQSSDIPIRF